MLIIRVTCIVAATASYCFAARSESSHLFSFIMNTDGAAILISLSGLRHWVYLRNQIKRTKEETGSLSESVWL